MNDREGGQDRIDPQNFVQRTNKYQLGPSGQIEVTHLLTKALKSARGELAVPTKQQLLGADRPHFGHIRHSLKD